MGLTSRHHRVHDQRTLGYKEAQSVSVTHCSRCWTRSSACAVAPACCMSTSAADCACPARVTETTSYLCCNSLHDWHGAAMRMACLWRKAGMHLTASTAHSALVCTVICIEVCNLCTHGHLSLTLTNYSSAASGFEAPHGTAHWSCSAVPDFSGPCFLKQSVGCLLRLSCFFPASGSWSTRVQSSGWGLLSIHHFRDGSNRQTLIDREGNMAVKS